MASHLAHSVQTSHASSSMQEKNLCFKSISVLQQLQGCIVSFTRMMNSPPALQGGAPAMNMPSCAVPDAPGLWDGFSEGQVDGSIASVAVQLCGTWKLARAYAACRVGPDSPPPWDARSDYSMVMQSHLRIDCRMPMKYRFASNNMNDYDFESLQRQRIYWGPFLFLQIVYAAVPCILNHPFLLSMRLRGFRHTIPQSFVQQSFEHITRHAGWIIYFIDLLEKKSFQASDPCLAHCVAIVATIHLQHSFTKDRQLSEKAQGGFEKCLRFLRRMATVWPGISFMVSIQHHQILF